jgi:putative intracellular protease/amidase
MTHRVLIVVSEKGYTWEEVFEPWRVLRQAGVEIAFASPTGVVPEPDPNGVKIRPLLSLLGYGVGRKIAPGSPLGVELLGALGQCQPLSAVDAGALDAIYIAGGHGALFDLHDHPELNRIILDLDAAQKPVSALCHSSSVLGTVQKEGQSLIANRKVTGFPTLLEYFILAVGWVHKNFRPLPRWTGRELNAQSKRRGLGLKLLELLNMRTVVVDGHIITGVGPKAAVGLGKKLLAALSSRGA